MKGKKARKTLTALGVGLFFSVGFMFLGMVMDIQIISKYDYTPISFTFTFLFFGALIGFLLAFKTVRQLNGV